MNKNIVMAKLRRQIAEIQEMIELLRGSEHAQEIIDVLDKQREQTEELLHTLTDPSFIPREVENLDLDSEIRDVTQKVAKTKEGLQRLEKLEKDIQIEKEKITKKILDENK